VTVWTDTAVTGITVHDGRVTGVTTDRGDVRCRHVVDAAGAWANQVAALAGVALPQSPVRSHFWITAPRDDVRPHQPVVRLPDASIYCRAEVGGLLIGVYEALSRAYDAREIGPAFSMAEVERDWDVFIDHLPRILPYLPSLESAQMVGAMAGLTNYPPDATYLIGPVPGVDGFHVASGCSGLGVTGSGGIGYAIAELITSGKSGLDIEPFRPDRFGRVDPYAPAFLHACALARSGSHSSVGATAR
jgi:4-methylaminobutanoate oxidase (formaldehyde-forming)